jgi:hypothetical protein
MGWQVSGSVKQINIQGYKKQNFTPGMNFGSHFMNKETSRH